jgi:hypothetical protein
VTHLVVGADKRTLKLLLGVAEGAHLMSPAWVTDSLAAGHWLPEEGYVAQVCVWGGCKVGARGGGGELYAACHVALAPTSLRQPGR